MVDRGGHFHRVLGVGGRGRSALDSLASRDYYSLMSAVAENKNAAGGLIVSNPRILGGTPVFRGTRLPVQTLFDYLADGLSLGYFLETFEGVSREQAQAVLRSVQFIKSE